MTKKGARQIVYVCSGLTKEGDLINKIFAALSPDDAANLFYDELGFKPKEILGPFYKKRKQVLETTRTIKFSQINKPAHYNEWVVNAFILTEPENSAYLVFKGRIDGKKVPSPSGTVIVSINDLRFI